jgi:mannonate dehydratase
MTRRSLLTGMIAAPLIPAHVQAQVERRTRGLPKLSIKDVKVIATSPRGRYQWVFVKIITSEPGLYGIGSASNVQQAAAVAKAIESFYAPGWIGKDPDRIEDLWQYTHVRSYWRNSTIQNNALSALDVALWDIKGKRANMPVYELLGGKARDAVPMYAHADGRDLPSLTESVRKYLAEGYRHVRVQLGGYGGGGFVEPGQGSRPREGFKGQAFDEDIYVETIPKMFEHLRVQLGKEVKLLHDVHEHLSPTMAVELCRRVEPYRLFFLEDVLPPEQIDWFRNIRQACTTPLSMGELNVNPHEWVPLITNRLIDFVRNRLSQTGGITAAKKTAALCEAHGVRTAWQEGGDNDPVNQLASYHVDMNITSFGIQEENHFPDDIHEMMPGTAKLIGGYLYGSDGPGLGIDLKEDIAAKWPLVPIPKGDIWTTVRGMDGSIVKP